MDTISSKPGWVEARAAGGLGLAHVVLLAAGLVLSGGGALLEEGRAGIERAYSSGDLTRILGGWFVESVGFVLLVPVAVFLSRHLGRSSEVGRWASRIALVLGGIYVAITLAVDFPAGAAAAYGVHHALDLDAAAALNSKRVFAYLLSRLCLGAYVICIAVSARADGFSPRFVGWLGLVTGVSLVAAAPWPCSPCRTCPLCSTSSGGWASVWSCCVGGRRLPDEWADRPPRTRIYGTLDR